MDANIDLVTQTAYVIMAFWALITVVVAAGALWALTWRIKCKA